MRIETGRLESKSGAGALLGLDRFAVARRVKRLAQVGGAEAAEAILAQQPAWVREVLAGQPPALPGEGLDLPAVCRELEEHVARRRRGESPELLDTLIAYDWKELLGPFTTDPADIVWS